MANVLALRTRPNPKLLLAEYLERVYPARRHGATDCGECLTRQDDADHMMQWLAERGIAVMGTKGTRL